MLGYPVCKDRSAEITNQFMKFYNIRTRRNFGAVRTHLAKQIVPLRRSF